MFSVQTFNVRSILNRVEDVTQCHMLSRPPGRLLSQYLPVEVVTAPLRPDKG